MTLSDPWDSYRTGWAKRDERRRRAVEERKKIIREAAARCARLLLDEFHATRVVLFGSGPTERVHAQSDLDLAVEGLPAGQYFRALSRACQLLPPGLDLDLVPLEDAEEPLRNRILSQGEVLGAAP